MSNQKEIQAEQERLTQTVADFFLEAGTSSTIAAFEAFVNEAALNSKTTLQDMGEPLFDMFRTMKLVARLSEIHERLDHYRREVERINHPSNTK